MSSEIAICNRTLTKLGAGTIITLDDDDPKAVALKIAYPAVRDAELRRKRWRFSLARKMLAANAVAPPWGFAKAYTLPADCLRVIQVGEYNIGPDLSDYRFSGLELFSIEGRELLTDLGAPLKLRYIRRITDVGLFDSCFVETLASRLGYETCYRITQSNEREDRCLRDYKISIREAIQANALEVVGQDMPDDTWIIGRRI